MRLHAAALAATANIQRNAAEAELITMSTLWTPRANKPPTIGYNAERRPTHIAAAPNGCRPLKEGRIGPNQKERNINRCRRGGT